MTCTTYVFERSLLIDGLSAGAKACLCAGVLILVSCTGGSRTPRAAEPIPAPDQNRTTLLPVADRTCDPFASTGRAGDTLDVVSTTPVVPGDLRTAPTAGHRFVFERAY